MSVMTTGRRAGLARVTALPRPQANEEGSGPDRRGRRGRWPGGQPVAFRQVTGYRQVREFRQVAEVRFARETRVAHAATGPRTGAVGRPAAGTPGHAALRPARRGGTRLTRRGRMVVTALLALAAVLVMAVVWLSVAASAQAADSGPPPASVYQNLTSVVVHPGQSLWSIASQAVPSADPRTVMQEIVDLNALQGTGLVPGQHLWVPRG
jgi:LysM domain